MRRTEGAVFGEGSRHDVLLVAGGGGDAPQLDVGRVPQLDRLGPRDDVALLEGAARGQRRHLSLRQNAIPNLQGRGGCDRCRTPRFDIKNR